MSAPLPEGALHLLVADGTAQLQPQQGPPDEAFPYCGATEGTRQTSTAGGRAQAWACDGCDTEWAFCAIGPDSRASALLSDLGAAAEEIGRLRCLLRQLVTLAGDAPTITDEQLRTRLLALAGRVVTR